MDYCPFPAPYRQLQDDVVGFDVNLCVATSTTYVTETVAETVDEFDELGDLEL